MKTKKLLKYLGLGLVGTTATTSGLSAADTDYNEAQKIFCSAVGFTDGMTNGCTNTNNMAGWVKFVQAGALLMTIYWGYKGSGISEQDQFNIKKLVAAGAAAALALQYGQIMQMIAGALGTTAS